MRHLARCALLVAALFSSTTALAQEETARILLPTPSIVDPADATALLLNPANLGLLESWSLVWLHARAVRDAEVAGAGDAVLLGVPMFGGLGLGTGLEVLGPTQPGARARATGIFSFSLAHRRAASLGFTYRGFVSDGDGRIDGLGEWSGGVTLRPAGFLSLAAAVRNLNTPVVLTVGPVPRVWTFGLGIRPTSRDALTLLGEVDVHEDDRPNVPRVVLEVAIPAVGALRVGAEHSLMEDGRRREVRADARLEVRASRLAVSGGAVGASRDPNARAWTLSARVSGDAYRGLPRLSRVRRIDLEDDLDVRTLALLTRGLRADSLDPSIDGVLLRPRADLGGLAAAQEIARRIEALRRRGRKVVCHLEEGTGSHLAACAGADRVWVAPAGGIRLVGVRSTALFFRDLLSRFGVRAQIVRVGDYKSAPEAFTRMSSSDPAREEAEALLDDDFDALVDALARGRGLSRAEVVRLIDEGPFTAPAAVDAGLADAMVHEDDLEEKLGDLHGGGVRLEEPPDPVEHPRRWGVAPAVAVVYVEDTIVDGDSFDVPLFGSRFTGGETIAETLRAVREDPRIGAVVLRIDSPGGSALASERIWREVRRTRRVKPVIASMAGVAASGGYYAASAADAIFAERSTTTGSIGIFYGKADVEDLLREVGVGVELSARGRRAHMESVFRPYTEDETAFLEREIRHFYRIFLRRVAAGRDKEVDEIDAIAQGRVWSGRRAREIGLVDRFGGLEEALREARARGGLPYDAEVVELPARPSGLLGLLFGGMAARESEEPTLPPVLRRLLRAAGPFAYLDPASPQALLPWVRVEREP